MLLPPAEKNTVLLCTFSVTTGFKSQDFKPKAVAYFKRIYQRSDYHFYAAFGTMLAGYVLNPGMNRKKKCHRHILIYPYAILISLCNTLTHDVAHKPWPWRT